MKVGQQFLWVGGVVLMGLGGLMVVSNPGSLAYEQYATERLTFYLKDEGCSQLTENLGGLGQGYCQSLVDTGRPQIQQIVAQQTKRQNYLLFSIYQTELLLPSPAPSYRFETIGIFQSFHVYQAEKL
jgi:hypothetical protein